MEIFFLRVAKFEDQLSNIRSLVNGYFKYMFTELVIK